jgi:hypothetical protein
MRCKLHFKCLWPAAIQIQDDNQHLGCRMTTGGEYAIFKEDRVPDQFSNAQSSNIKHANIISPFTCRKGGEST